ncbi:DUF3263 domain-containing protein [Brevibacterium marinum]|nr:DUF3263 domain-containing protein [Brevibacterium marinum]
MIAGDAQQLSAHDRMILDVECGSPTPAARRLLCDRIDLAPERYDTVLNGLADTDAAYSYAPEVVRTVRHSRAERFRFYRRARRWTTWDHIVEKGDPT